MNLLDLEQALELFLRIEGQRAVVRDLGGLESALHRPRVTVFGEDAYPTIHLKAAALMEAINRNHPLVDGNKRLSWIVARAAYLANGYRHCTLDEDGRYELVLAVATAELELDELADRLAETFHR